MADERKAHVTWRCPVDGKRLVPTDYGAYHQDRTYTQFHFRCEDPTCPGAMEQIYRYQGAYRPAGLPVAHAG